jgi:diguanylate cyclase (GGDEF)-like protein/PAS domain S-box-containing protein
VSTGPGALPTADRLSVFVHAPVGVAVCAGDGVVLDANRALAELLGRPVAELTGRSIFALVHPDDVEAAREAAEWLARHPERPMRHETRLVCEAGTAVSVQVSASLVPPAHEDEAPHLVVFIEDITERKALEAQLVHRSLHDPLTGLPNRILFTDRLRHALERGHREQTPTCVLVIDLDGFKAINDALGHAVGDAVLVAFAERLRAVLRASDTAARLGGDEFSIVCENTDRADAEVLADRLRRGVQEPLVLDGTTVPLGMSIGIGWAPGGTEPQEVLERLVREADDAMYADKRPRRGLNRS